MKELSLSMEVHHHPDMHQKSKNWKVYFLEFFMLFLAVTLGFLAENLREHVKDAAKEKQYIEGFVRNVKDDIANLNHVIEFDKHQIEGVDSMLRLSHVNMAIDSNRKSFYLLALSYFYNSASFKSNDATLQQLKSTGDYRLIEKDHVADSLTKYDRDIHNIYDQGEYYESYFKDILSRLDDLTDMTVLLDTSFVKNGKLLNKPLPLLRDTQGKLQTLFNKCFDFKTITYAYYANFLTPQLENSKNIVAFLEKEYEIKD